MRVFKTSLVRVAEDSFGVAFNPLTVRMSGVTRFTLTNNQQMSVQVMTLGASICSVKVPDAKGCVEEVALGFEHVSEYEKQTDCYMGATIGRVCNRIKNGEFSIFHRKFELSRNLLGRHHLHGGFYGFHKANWKVNTVLQNGVTMEMCSADGAEGYPGELTARVTYLLTEDNCLKILMCANTTKRTPVNMTNHTYFNLAGHDAGTRGLYNHWLRIHSNRIIETYQDLLPTGRLRVLQRTPYDFRTITNLGDRLHAPNWNGYDTNFCVLRQRKQATIIHSPSGRWLTVYSNQPNLFFSTANNLPDVKKGEVPLSGRHNAKYVKHGAFSMQTQEYPNAINTFDFPTTMLIPGQCYNHVVTYKFGVKRPGFDLKWYPIV